MPVSTETDPSRDSVEGLGEKDRRILELIQSEFPLDRSPYREIAKRTGLSEEEAQDRVSALRRSGVIRRIGGVLNSRKLGFVGTLVGMKVPPDRIDDVADVVNALPNVTHNYLREHEYNMWFTISATSPEKLAEIVEHVKCRSGITEILNLPSLKTFKINVQLNFNRKCRSH